MGREIRMVPPNWENPKDYKGDYHPMFDEVYETAAQEWLEGLAAFKPNEDAQFYWEWEGMPPDKEYYHSAWDNATWCQVYETVSEGTPVTPPFATKEELIDYLVENGDFWDQHRGAGGWTRENATAFVNRGWAPSLIVNRTATETTIKAPRDGA